MRKKTHSWILMAPYVVGGVGLFYYISKFAAVFGEVGESLPIPTRVVMFVGPAGWLALAVLSALITFRCRSERGREILTIAFLLIALGVACTLLFTPLVSHMRNA